MRHAFLFIIIIILVGRREERKKTNSQSKSSEEKPTWHGIDIPGRQPGKGHKIGDI
jgi:hypothetical protein